MSFGVAAMCDCAWLCTYLGKKHVPVLSKGRGARLNENMVKSCLDSKGAWLKKHGPNISGKRYRLKKKMAQSFLDGKGAKFKQMAESFLEGKGA